MEASFTAKMQAGKLEEGEGHPIDDLPVRSGQELPAQFLAARTDGKGYSVRILSTSLRQICISVLNRF